jgi:hypothetical protein
MMRQTTGQVAITQARFCNGLAYWEQSTSAIAMDSFFGAMHAIHYYPHYQDIQDLL